MLKLLKRLWYALSPLADLELAELDGNYLKGLTPDKIQGIYQELFNTFAGKIVLADLEAKYSRSTVVREKARPIDPLDMAVREGGRIVLLRIKNLSKKE
jgi:hypothetical protein